MLNVIHFKNLKYRMKTLTYDVVPSNLFIIHIRHMPQVLKLLRMKLGLPLQSFPLYNILLCKYTDTCDYVLCIKCVLQYLKEILHYSLSCQHVQPFLIRKERYNRHTQRMLHLNHVVYLQE